MDVLHEGSIEILSVRNTASFIGLDARASRILTSPKQCAKSRSFSGPVLDKCATAAKQSMKKKELVCHKKKSFMEAFKNTAAVDHFTP